MGLEGWGRPDGYLERQIRRWGRQWDQAHSRPRTAVAEILRLLERHRPVTVHTGIVHGDVKLDNLMVARDAPRPALGLLDWEMSTLGDTLADVGLLAVYWTDATDEGAALLAAPTMAAGFPTKAELIARYAASSDRDLSSLDFYVAFGYWKLACIIEGVYSRYAGGAMGDASGFEGFANQVTALAERAATFADRAGIA